MTSVVAFEPHKDSGRKDGETDQAINVRGVSASGLHGAGGLQESLPLFSENVFQDCIAQASGSSGLGNSGHKLTNRRHPDGRQDHLASAKRLSRAMRQIPTNSKQHIQAGRLVCRHLVAMLHDSPPHSLRISGKLAN